MLSRLTPYSCGPAPPPRAARLHLNEYRFELPVAVLGAADREAAHASRHLSEYQTGEGAAALAAGIATYVGLAPQNVLVTAGSDDALRAIVDSFGCGGGTQVLMCVPSYTHFAQFVHLRGLNMTECNVGIGSSSADVYEAVRYNTGPLKVGALVYICSPNNPTGCVIDPAHVIALAAEFPNSTFLIDEAYTEFAGAAAAVDVTADATDAAALNSRSAVAAAAAHANVVVTRTFSKAFGLAAIRIGYVVGQPKTLARVGVAVSPKALAPGAPAVALAALGCLGEYRRNAAATVAEGLRAADELRKMGWWVRTSPANFFLVWAGPESGASKRLLDELATGSSAVCARDRSDLPGLAGFIRVTAGTPADTAAVIAAFSAATISAFARAPSGIPPPLTTPPQQWFTPKGRVAAIKTLLRMAIRILSRCQFEFFATSGTLLGALRHGGMIPWDDDADLGYVRCGGVDPAVSHGLEVEFAAEGLSFQRNRTDAYWQIGTNAPGQKISDAHIDLFSYSLDSVLGRYVTDDERFRAEDPECARADCNPSFSPSELWPLVGCRFYDMALPIPARAVAGLRRACGDNFMTRARVRMPGGDAAVEFDLADTSPA